MSTFKAFLKPFSYNIAPTQAMLAVRYNPEPSQRTLDALRWGLIPHRASYRIREFGDFSLWRVVVMLWMVSRQRESTAEYNLAARYYIVGRTF